MIRLGVVDFDSSHSVEFTKRLNHLGTPEEQWVHGARVVLGCALPSGITDQSRVDEYARVFSQDLGVPLVAAPEEMLGRIDGVLIEAVDGSVHLERVRPFLEAGIPAFVDKPFTCSLAEAQELFDLAAVQGVPVFSCSSLRYAPDVVAARTNGASAGAILGCDAYSPASTHPWNPGLFHYGIHGVETLFALMGTGCESVTARSEPGGEVALGRWKDGRLGTFRGTREGAHAYGCTLFGEKQVVPLAIGTQFIYRELLNRIVGMFESGRAPMKPAETLEIVAFIEAAAQSSARGGEPVRLATA